MAMRTKCRKSENFSNASTNRGWPNIAYRAFEKCPHNGTMSTITRAIAKGIPPRVRSPGGKTKKKSALKPSTKPAPKHHKRNAQDDESEETSDNESEPKAKKKCSKRRRTEESPQSEVEVVDGAEPEPLVEEVEEDDPEIYNTRGMGSMTVNVATNSEKNQ